MNRLLGLLVVCGYLFASCSSIRPLELRSVSELTLRNGASPRIEADLRLHNPNRIGATLMPSTLELRLEGVTLSDIQLEQTRLTPRSDFDLPVSAGISYADLLMAAPAVAVSLLADRRFTVEVRGTLHLRKFLFSRRYDVALRQEVRLRDLRLR
ncbi:MAG: LEA type 2 family protein [Chitinophagales bacterium]|nr:LEA type 2 family protein [Chitinophagales bacterium]MDW8393331.1 LEA type 2 family protein [Chitinophagales bacterium]